MARMRRGIGSAGWAPRLKAGLLILALPAGPLAAAEPAGAPPPAAPRPLEVLRGEIDRIDGGLLGLLNARAGIVAEVGAAKGATGGPVFRPGRQASLLRKLIARNEGPQTSATLVQVWTAIIAGSILQQKPDFSVVATGNAGEQQTARSYFGAAIPVAAVADPDAAVAALAAGRADAVALPPAGHWWRALPAGVHVIAMAPLLRVDTAPSFMLILARQEPDRSGTDLTLVRVPAPAAGGAEVLAESDGEALVALAPGAAVPDGAKVVGLAAAPLPARP